MRPSVRRTCTHPVDMPYSTGNICAKTSANLSGRRRADGMCPLSLELSRYRRSYSARNSALLIAWVASFCCPALSPNNVSRLELFPAAAWVVVGEGRAILLVRSRTTDSSVLKTLSIDSWANTLGAQISAANAAAMNWLPAPCFIVCVIVAYLGMATSVGPEGQHVFCATDFGIGDDPVQANVAGKSK